MNRQKDRPPRVSVRVDLAVDVDRAIEIEVARRGGITKREFIESALRAALKLNRAA